MRWNDEPDMRAPASSGLAAAAVGVAAAEIVAALAGRSSLIDAGARYAADKIPVPMVELAVRLLRGRDKPALRTGVALTALGVGAALGRLPGRAPDAGLAGLAAAAALVALRVPPRQPLLPATAGAGAAMCIRSLVRSRRTATASTVAGVVGLGAARILTAGRAWRHERRVAALRLPIGQRLPPASDGAEEWGHPMPLVTPVERFYVVDVNFGVPLINPDVWRLKVRGLVRDPVDLSWDELTALGTAEFDSVMVCIHNDTDGRRVGNARWTAVPLERLAALVHPSDRVVALETRSVDGYTITLPAHPTADAKFPGYVVVGMNGRVLTAEHGFPARVLVPGLFGQYAGAKWLTELAFVCERQADYWGARGWPAEPVGITPQARIDTPGHRTLVSRAVQVAGVAWAQSGVAGVEVAVDNGPWYRAELAAELAPHAWRRWRYRPADLGGGSHRLTARAIAADGTVQEGRRRPYYPAGVGGYHAINVTTGAGAAT